MPKKKSKIIVVDVVTSSGLVVKVIKYIGIDPDNPNKDYILPFPTERKNKKKKKKKK
jgi:hypothetical protein